MEPLNAKDGDAPSAELFKSFCAMGFRSWIWFVLWEAGEAQRFTDILHIVGCSRTPLSKSLKKLQMAGLVRKVGARYKAVSIFPKESGRVRELKETINKFEADASLAKFFRSLCALSLEPWIWFILWEAGEAQRFTDILHIVGCSRSKLSKTLRELQMAKLVRKVGARYEAVSPVPN